MAEDQAHDQNRDPRELETRDATSRERFWQRPETLPTPNPREGFVHRYIRVAMVGQNDAMNVSAKLREGWEPVKAKDYPEITNFVVENTALKDNIVIGGLMLCRAPVEMANQRDEHFQNMNAQQLQAVDNNLMRENDPRMPLFKEGKTSVSFGKGN